jgi:SAM-dependent methyltransferase
MIHYTNCPACQSPSVYPVLSAKDHTVSQEAFEVYHCRDCTLRFTQDVPSLQDIGPYYRSAAYISHSDTQTGLINRLYHRVRNHTLQTKRKLLLRVTGRQTGYLLDVGAGTGAFAYTMQQAGWKVTGLEPDTVARNNADLKYGLKLLSPVELYHLPATQFDAITLWHVLEHVHDLHGYLEKFSVLLKPGGKLIIAVPNYTSHDANVYRANWAAYDVPRHLYHFSPGAMERLCLLKGFTMEGIQPMWFDSFYVSMLSEKYRNGKGNIISAVWNGMISNLKAISDKRKCSSVIYIFSKSL